MFLDWPHQLSLGNYFGILIKSGSEFPQDFIRHDLMGVKLAEILTQLASPGIVKNPIWFKRVDSFDTGNLLESLYD